jgi:hypothetical protein
LALYVSRIRGECVREDQKVIGTPRHKVGFLRRIRPLAIVTWMTEGNESKGSIAGPNLEDC